MHDFEMAQLVVLLCALIQAPLKPLLKVGDAPMIPLAKPGGRKASTRAASVTQSLAVWASQQKYHGTWDVQFANGKLWKPHFSGVFVEFCIGCSGLACVMRWLPEGRGYRNIFDAVATSDWSDQRQTGSDFLKKNEEWGMHPGHNPLSTSINYSNARIR